MTSGLLWYDDSPTKELSKKVGAACRRYYQKFGMHPTACYVHPSAIKEQTEMCGVTVSPLSSVLRHHFWVGLEEHGN